MKKTKILLFGLVLSLLSIGFFSSAYEITDTYNFVNTSSPSVNINSSNVLKIVCNSDSGRLRVRTQQPPYEAQGDVLVCPNTKNVNKRYNILSMSLLEGSNVSVSVLSDSPTLPFNKLFVLFTPIITGLTTSINEFIPYIVYISLGILGVVIGFFAIKRLMRYVKGSTLSVFSSRRKRK